jgi:hypothetical protein
VTATEVGPCPCECNASPPQFCGGCGHAGCGRRRQTTDVKYPDVTVQLTGRDGNVFAILGQVQRAPREAGHPEAADQFVNEAMGLGSYDAVLRFAMATVEVL